MSNRRTFQALREAAYSTLTVPAISFTLPNSMTTTTLTLGQVIPKNVWETGGAQAPTPMIAYNVGENVLHFRTADFRAFTLKFWIVSSAGTDEIVEIFEQVRNRFHLADNESLPNGPTDISRATTPTNLGIVILESKMVKVTEPEFDPASKRWYLTAEFNITAQ